MEDSLVGEPDKIGIADADKLLWVAVVYILSDEDAALVVTVESIVFEAEVTEKLNKDS